MESLLRDRTPAELADLFAAHELEDAGTGPGRTASLAARFAAKEACAKALGTGLRAGVFWRDMGVVNLPSGQPSMALTGGAAKRLAEITPGGMRAQINLTLTDDYPLAQAIVIITAVAEPPQNNKNSSTLYKRT